MRYQTRILPMQLKWLKSTSCDLTEMRKISTSHVRRSNPPPLYMVVPDLKDGNFKEFDLVFQQEAMRLVCIPTILLEYVLKYNEVGEYRADWSGR